MRCPRVLCFSPRSVAGAVAAALLLHITLHADAACATGGSILFCEDFEALPPGITTSTATWTIQGASSMATVDSVHARGTQALHIAATGASKAFIYPTAFAPPMNSVFGRMWIFMDAFPTAPDFAHFTLVEASGAVGDGTLVRPIGGQFIPGVSTHALWGTGSDGGPTGDWLNWRATTPTADATWTCLEFQLDNPTSTINVWIDGVAKPELTVSKNFHNGTQVPFVFPTFDKIGMGFQEYQGGTTPATFNLWVDDITLATTRVGCNGAVSQA
ncbi:hypothetical protein M427DRAFT_137265 [Gonapodya prolifera JEL478]|uniref:Cip1-like core domain-containing protein n=1 Tax=Gonapodya prolifera (strain JEL478) TaxID=1344416 RepID=A0A139A6H1_GONPJ|nr:hypothetical protein M427DRAFT_137265 [Gonapodya prolifera JEL478]|eukprot:KXS12361.1 hypothetical protein M427DRAFT_137265 [Gonapodya prolifera JEL478]